MSKLPDYHPQTELRIEPPLGRSKSFRIRYRSPDTDNKWTPLQLPEIDLANKLLKTGVATEEHTLDKLKLILAAQYVHRDRKKKKLKAHSGNEDIIKRMFEDKYDRQRTRKMKGPEDSWYQLEKAVEACGMFPLDTCDLKELANHLHKEDDQNRLARRIVWVNSILQWLGRNKIAAVDRERPSVKYLNEDEFSLVCAKLPDHETKLLARIAFYTGARLGEIFFIQPRHVKDKSLLLEFQVTTDKKKDGTFKDDTLKNGHPREVFLYKPVKADVLEWAKTPMKRRYEIRMKSYATIVARACRKVFSDDSKVLCFHDLRHCHAIWLLQKGATITEVAQQLGNSPEVCYRYYSGHDLKKESVDRLERLAQPATPLVVSKALLKALAKDGLTFKDGAIVKLG